MKTHRFNPVAGGMGLVFVILAVGFFLDAIDAWDAEVAWLAPVFLIAFGAAGVLSTRRARQPVRTAAAVRPRVGRAAGRAPSTRRPPQEMPPEPPTVTRRTPPESPDVRT